MFPEGPRWRDGALWFSDQLGGVVRRLVEGGSGDRDGDGGSSGDGVTVVARLEHPSGLGFLPDGALLVASMSERTVLRIAGEQVSVHADLSDRAKHLNDAYVDEHGRVYVDAYASGWRSGELLLIDERGEVSVAAPDVDYPNGVAVTPDGSTLLVSETYGACVSAFDVGPDGGLSNRRVWAALPDRAPDGLCLDAEGAAWVACFRSGEFVRVREGGEVTDRLTVEGRWAMACALGGDDGRTLFLCSAETDGDRYHRGESVGHLEAVRVDVPGVCRP